MGEIDAWSLPDGVEYDAADILGYSARATDGVLGTVIKATTEPTRSYLVLSSRPWLDAAMAILPAGLIVRVDHEQEAITLDVSRDDVRAAPAFAPDRYQDGAYHAEVAAHYLRDRLADALR